MKQLLSACLGLMIFASPAWSNHQNLVDLVLEKKVMGQLYSGNRPMINLNNYKVQNYTQSASAQGPMRSVQQPVGPGQRAYMKQYEVVDKPGHYQSLIQIRELGSGRVRGHISVGRRIQKLIAHPNQHRLYVLCGGYFGSVWEIDTRRDVVLRKLPLNAEVSPLWNPQDMVLLNDGQTLAVGSGRLHLIDLHQGRLIRDLPLPEQAVEITAMRPLRQNGVGLRVRQHNGSAKAYHYHPDDEMLHAGGGASENYHPHKVRVRTAYSPAPAVSRMMFMAGRNTDYISMVDRETLETVGILPLDFNVDDLALSPDRKRLFAYNGRFGQISVIELNPRSEEQFSVIKRFRDPRFKHSPPMKLTSAASRVFLWDGVGTVRASFEQDSLYPRVNLPTNVQLREPHERVWVSMPAHQRYYIREGQLFSEYVGHAPRALVKPIELGGDVIDIVLSPDRHHMYALLKNPTGIEAGLNNQQAPYELLHLDAETHQVQNRTALDLRPLSLSISNSGERLLVTDADEGLLLTLNAQTLEQSLPRRVDMGREQPYQITLFHPGQTQIIEIELPRYMTDVVRVAR